jgi:hypothetical protein
VWIDSPRFDELSQIFRDKFVQQYQQNPIRRALTAPSAGGSLSGLKDRRIPMVRELQIMAVGLVFLFLGAIVVGVF